MSGLLTVELLEEVVELNMDWLLLLVVVVVVVVVVVDGGIELFDECKGLCDFFSMFSTLEKYKKCLNEMK